MKIEKKNNGYRIRKTIDGKVYSLTTKDKPTKQEIAEWEASLYSKTYKAPTKKSTFRQAATQYIETKENILSQTSVREYYLKVNRIPEWFTRLSMDKITYFEVQKVINEYSVNHSPKTVRDINAFITSVLGFYGVRIDKTINLPQKIKQDDYLPTDDDIRRIIEAAKGTQYEGMIGLAVCGLRRSEICGITAEDIKNNVVHINKALVQDKDKKWVVKTTKTTQSAREVPIPKELAKWIKNHGKAYDGFPGSINKWLTVTEKSLGIPHFCFHQFRHYFASKLIYLGYSKREVEVLGGWEKNSQVLESIYSQCMLANTDNGRRVIMDRFTESLF